MKLQNLEEQWVCNIYVSFSTRYIANKELEYEQWKHLIGDNFTSPKQLFIPSQKN